MPSTRLRRLLLDIYRRLYEHFGPQHWWPGESAFEVCIGAILTQSAAWGNVEKALANLKAAGIFSPQALRKAPQERLALLLRPSGYFNVKAHKVKAFVEYLGQRHGDDLSSMAAMPMDKLREELLAVHGIGEETADDILLYAVGKPSFVVDAYTRRILTRLGLALQGHSYTAYRSLFMSNLPADAALFNEYHALLVRLGKHLCRKEPRCHDCPLLDLCPTGAAQRPQAAR